MKFLNYIKGIFDGVWNLLMGLKISMLNFLRPKVTEQYPENRGKQVYFERFRAVLTMPHNEKNEHKCIACGICQNACPNGTIKVTTKQVVDETTGKPKRMLEHYIYDLGTCIFCNACVDACPQDAIQFSNDFEQAVFSRDRLVLQLNKPGSRVAAKPVVAKPAAPATPKPAVSKENGKTE